MIHMGSPCGKSALAHQAPAESGGRVLRVILKHRNVETGSDFIINSEGDAGGHDTAVAAFSLPGKRPADGCLEIFCNFREGKLRCVAFHKSFLLIFKTECEDLSEIMPEKRIAKFTHGFRIGIVDNVGAVNQHGIQSHFPRLFHETEHAFALPGVISRNFIPVFRTEHFPVFPVGNGNFSTVRDHAAPPCRRPQLLFYAARPELDDISLIFRYGFFQIPFGIVIFRHPCCEESSGSDGVIGIGHIDGRTDVNAAFRQMKLVFFHNIPC